MNRRHTLQVDEDKVDKLRAIHAAGISAKFCGLLKRAVLACTISKLTDDENTDDN